MSGLIGSCREQAETGAPGSTHEVQAVSSAAPDVYKPSGTITADDPTFIMTSDTVSAYGPHSITRNVLQDRNGTMWFATWQGIIRYSGKAFTNMTLKAGLKQFHVFSLLEDRAGNIWFGTIGGGMYRYDPSTSLSTGRKSFTYFTTKDGLAGNTVFCMLEDKNGTLWFGTDKGLSRYNSRTFTNFTKKDGLLHDSVYAMVQDNTGKLWIGTEGGVSSCYSPSASPVIFTKEKDLFFRHVMAMIKDKNGKIWIGSQAGLHCYDPVVEERSLIKITTDFVSNLFEDKAGRIWFGGDVNCYSGGTATHYTIREGQNSNNLFCIFEDNSGNFWFGSMDGLRRYQGKPLPDGKGNFTDFHKP